MKVNIQKRFFSNIPGDLMGGITAGVVALPLALAFGVASGLGAAAGLYGAIAAGIIASIFGGTPGQITGPTGPMTVVAAAIIATHAGRPDLIFLAVVLSGVIQIVFGVFKVGQLIQYVPYPVVSGFMSGIGVIIILLQIEPLFGLKTYGDVEEAMSHYFEIPTAFNPQATLIGILTIIIIYALPKVTKKIPPPLVALIVCSFLSVALGFDIPRIGEIPSGFPAPKFHILTGLEFHLIIASAFSLAVLGALDSLLTSVVMDRITGKKHDSDLELVGQGLGNICSGLIGGLPSAGATMRSLVNVKSGGTSYLSGIIHGLVLLLVLISLGSIASQIPLACLAGILITVGIAIIDYRGIKSIRKAPKADVTVLLLVLFLTVFVDLMIAVLVGFTVASILFVKKISDLRLSRYGRLANLDDLHEAGKGISDDLKKNIYVYQFSGPIFFGEVKNFNNAISEISGVKYLIIKFIDVPIVDQSGAYAIEDLVVEMKRKDINVIFVGIDGKVREVFENLGTLDVISAEEDCPTLEDAMQKIKG